LKGLASRVLDGAVEGSGEAKTTETEETKTASERETAVVAAVRIDSGELLEKVQWALTQGVSQLLKVKSQDIDADVEFSEYGFDSISLTEFTNVLNQSYQLELMPTIFFEYPTLGGLADYLVKEHRAALAKKFLVSRTAVERRIEGREEVEEPVARQQGSEAER